MVVFTLINHIKDSHYRVKIKDTNIAHKFFDIIATNRFNKVMDLQYVILISHNDNYYEKEF